MSSVVEQDDELASIRDQENNGETDIKDLQTNIQGQNYLDIKKSSLSTQNLGDGIVSPSGQGRSAKRRNVRDEMRSTNKSHTSNYSGCN